MIYFIVLKFHIFSRKDYNHSLSVYSYISNFVFPHLLSKYLFNQLYFYQNFLCNFSIMKEWILTSLSTKCSNHIYDHILSALAVATFQQRSYSINTNDRPSVYLSVCLSVCPSGLGGNVIFSSSCFTKPLNQLFFKIVLYIYFFHTIIHIS